ncbi:MAG: bifunctional hydroxymethylpyrimidine kinase/phosphomethylpyrimidine kinase [Prevotella sp.]|nr:bifunctional hydroxymethylpyrimidine kinase/phosphomethylpyrimidine kinase [Prevotella sp.]
MNNKKTILTITGSDPTGLSGIQADGRTIAALGGHALSAITSITVQTTLGIQQFYDVSAEIVAGQIDAAMNDFQPQTVKIGMLRHADVLNTIVEALSRYKPRHVVYVPVVSSSQGEELMSREAIRQIVGKLLPLTTLIVARRQDAEALALTADDRVCLLDDATTHGLTNHFASAAAFYLSTGLTVADALQKARTYVSTLVVRSDHLQGRASTLYNEFLFELQACHRSNRDVAFYADRLNVSSRYLAQVTRRIAGKTPKAIIDDYLIGEICRELLNTGQTVQEIAYAFSFSSQAQLTKFFQKMKSTTPTKFRQQ